MSVFFAEILFSAAIFFYVVNYAVRLVDTHLLRISADLLQSSACLHLFSPEVEQEKVELKAKLSSLSSSQIRKRFRFSKGLHATMHGMLVNSKVMVEFYLGSKSSDMFSGRLWLILFSIDTVHAGNFAARGKFLLPINFV